jgi:toxin ParE1/3/4
MGRERPEIAPDVRSFPVERWVIFYMVREDEVVISRIVDGARDIRRVHLPKR